MKESNKKRSCLVIGKTNNKRFERVDTRIIRSPNPVNHNAEGWKGSRKFIETIRSSTSLSLRLHGNINNHENKSYISNKISKDRNSEDGEMKQLLIGDRKWRSTPQGILQRTTGKYLSQGGVTIEIHGIQLKHKFPRTQVRHNRIKSSITTTLLNHFCY